MASRAILLSFVETRPTYNDDILMDYKVSFMEFGNVITEQMTTQVALADNMATVATKIAADIRARAIQLGMSAVAANNVWLPSYAKS